MSRLWSHAPYAEDQARSKEILSTHVLFRGFESGAMVGPVVGTAYHLLRLRRTVAPPSFYVTLVRSCGVGATIFTSASAVGLVARMWNREEIEWKDRAWRLLENKGQVEVDDWGVGGMALGGATLADLGE